MRTFTRLMRASLLVLASTLVLLIGGITVLLIGLTNSIPTWTGKVELPGLSSAAQIVRDENGVAHIIAGGDEDAYRTLGYAHAQDRLWQMDLYRRIAAGRVAEILGKPGLKIDIFMRTLGLYRAVEPQLSNLTPSLENALNAYASGVNAFLENNKSILPPEFTFLAYKPEKWQPADSLVLSKLLALMLGGNWLEELKRAALIDKLGPARAEVLLPNRAGQQRKLIGSNYFPEAQRLLATVPDIMRPRRASNSWVVSGKHTASGLPILANDPHLALTAPGIWYLARIVTPSLELTGATIPGMPLHLLGHNNYIAWGLTTTYGDQTDLVIEKLNPKDKSKYRWNNNYKTFELKNERISVRVGRDKSISIRKTSNGPVISDILEGAKNNNKDDTIIALRAAWLRSEDQTPNAIHALNRAKNWTSFVGAMKNFSSPQQNIFFGSRTGDIGFLAPAWLPIRRSGHGLVPIEGGRSPWIGSIPFLDLPKHKNPDSGILFNANNSIVDDSYPHFISADWDAPFRANRLKQLLNKLKNSSVNDHARIQTDTYSAMAEELLPIMLSGISPKLAKHKIVNLLRDWNYEMERGSAAPLIFVSWLHELHTDIFKDELDSLFHRVANFRAESIKIVLGTEQSWCDNTTTTLIETCTKLLTDSLNKTIKELQKTYGENEDAWQWGDAHLAVFVHPILSLSSWTRQALKIETPTHGGKYTLMRGAFAGKGARPFVNSHAATYRAVYDLSNLSNSLFSYAPGMSGNPYSKFFSDSISAWRDGQYFHVPLSKNILCARARGILLLIPNTTKKTLKQTGQQDKFCGLRHYQEKRAQH